MKKIAIFFFILFFLIFYVYGEDQKEKKPWHLSLEELIKPVTLIRAGKDLTPDSWPNGSKVAVGLSFDFDAETIYLRKNIKDPASLSRAEYGARAGIPRILNLLDKYNIPATFFVPAVSAILHQDKIKEILSREKHEIGIHGWVHEPIPQLSEEEERELMKKAINTLTKITGKKPVGYRSPSWYFNPQTLPILKEFGFIYDSSLMADDKPYEILFKNQRTGIVELPVEWLLDDFPYFGFNWQSGLHNQRSSEDVFTIWKAEFDKAYEEGTIFILTMHPHVIGHRSRILMLEKLIRYMKSHPKVWFATHEQIARYIIQARNLKQAD
ncbi:polysaccharide deacetylase [Candidatus Aminicenantes bacterium AC-335-A11]|jgi:peptidoglycan/xylan/chitin deacetylase (PgdA/CDA1 family)|nr:polysaccharide deacetylase [SCandidatus Aminicenantes bacterium Aminicenantia_JdfR_composite]MCP2597592.1 polysaccharide deacetylase [Candidatus Aminicenantes bacterium AC-335-G13]MCP2598720.1 polysaccharide deacetylase [Candidatus Aminicenantes bacterium AC-335-L06]MCP2618756.1 polysaccharide deacetylase [Candidatus Aminicenantes bacterium AC-335-A11]